VRTPNVPGTAPRVSQRLIRMRICTLDCQNLTRDESTVAADCASAYTQDNPLIPVLGRSCRGDFVCMNGVDVRASGVAEGLDYVGTELPEITFCQGGVVLGRDPLQPPGLWPLL
jgi:hypothetical protein